MNDRIYNNGIDKLRSPERIQRLELAKIVEYCLGNGIGNTLLDIGTGSGLFAEAFSNAGLIVSGIDINKEMIRIVSKYLPDSIFKVALAEEIPFEDNSFDTTFFGCVFHELSDYKKALIESYRVTNLYTYILEWKYISEEFGPPIEHRLNSEFISSLSKEAGYKKIIEIPMNNFILYQLVKVLENDDN